MEQTKRQQDSLTPTGIPLQPSIHIDPQLKYELDANQQGNPGISIGYKRSREDESGFGGSHKDDPKKSTGWLTAREVPPHATITSTTSTTPTLQTQLRSSLLPDPESNAENYSSYSSPKSSAPADTDDAPRLPSIKQMRLDTATLDPHSRPHWDYYSHLNSTPTQAYPTSTTTTNYPTTTYPARSPLNMTQTINPPPAPPSSYTTELVPVKTNNYGFIETTFTTAPVKKV